MVRHCHRPQWTEYATPQVRLDTCICGATRARPRVWVAPPPVKWIKDIASKAPQPPAGTGREEEP